MLAAGLLAPVLLASGCASVASGATAAPAARPDSPAALPATTSGPAATASPAAPPSTRPASTPASRPSPEPSPSPSPKPSPQHGSAAAALALLPVKGRAPRTGYERELFGQAWSDVDRNGCDTRNDMLRRDLTDDVLKAGTRGCVVLRGTLADPYTGARIAFVRGATTSARVQVDHVVALSDAWQKGAQRLSLAQRTAFANDPLNLLAVDGPTNQRKGDGDAATWLPPRKAYRCAYVARQVAVKRKHGLWVTGAERDAIARVLSACPGQRLPSAGPVPLGGGRVESAPAPKPAPRPSSSPAPAGSGASGTSGRTDPRFGTCREAIAAGYGPYTAGRDPEYDWYQDRDGDGVVCE
ncbi:MAG TPA: DUF1524 domain-containing protein [Pedococcus sp.]